MEKTERIVLPPEATTQLRHAAGRLSGHTGLPFGRAAGRSIRVDPEAGPDPRLGTQGYTIRTTPAGITIHATTEVGAANGVYTLLRTLLIEGRKDPFSRVWDLTEKPQFGIRSMIVAPYRFGGSFGYAGLSLDRWLFEDWKDYIDRMRLCNMTALVLAPFRVIHPDYPQTRRDQWQMEVWKQVMDYCHQVGMRFEWFISPTLVAEQAFFDNPELWGDKHGGAWFGNELHWVKGKDVILRNHEYTLEFLRGMDALHLMYNDGGGILADIPDPAAVYAEQTRAYQELIRRTGNDSQLVYWNWWMDFWARVLPEDIARKYPRYRTVQDDIVPLLPDDVAWLDTSALTQLQVSGHLMRAAGDAPVREGLLIGKEHGFRPVIDLFWYTNPEFAFNMFPHPYLQRAIQEARYARDEIQADGAMGYRLAPPLHYVDDYAFFRVASDPTLTPERIAGEAAGLLGVEPGLRPKAVDAIQTLERFWSTRRVEDLVAAERGFAAFDTAASSRHLRQVSNGVTFLSYIIRMAQPELTEAEREKLKVELRERSRGMPIFHGLVADVVWRPEADQVFSSRVDHMVHDYRSGFVTAHVMEVVDRSLYPTATSAAYQPRWPQREA